MMRAGEELPTGNEKAAVVRRMFDAIAPRYDLLNRIMTFGLDLSWRRKAVKLMRLTPGSRVLDVACGTGDFCRLLERAGHRPVGVDFAFQMLAAARTGAPLIQGDALRPPVGDACVAGITCGFALRNVVDIGRLLEEFARVLEPGGRLALLEVSEPNARLPRAVHRLYFRKVVPLIGGLLSDRRAYSYLPQSTAYLPPAAELLDLVRFSGFADARRKVVGLGAAQIIVGTRK